MKIIEKKFYSYPLPHRVFINGIEIKEKTGVLYKIRKSNEENFTDKIIDLSPFKGFSDDNLNDLCDEFESKLNKQELSHSKNPHLEFAYFQLANFERALKETLKGSIKNNDLYHENYDLKQRTSNIVKIKVRDHGEFNSFLNILENSSGEILWRVDSNANLDLTEFLTFVEKLDSRNKLSQIDYFEEPLKNFTDYLTLSEKLSYKDQQMPSIAHEEHLKEALTHQNYNFHAGVVKPSQQGISVVESLKISGRRIILSSAYETPYSLRLCHFLASQLPLETHGLGLVAPLSELIWT